MKAAFINFIILILASCIGLFAQKLDKPSQKQTKIILHNLDDKAVPLFVFTYLDPWGKIYGSDSPELALYQDGTLIFTKCREKDNPYSCYFMTTKLSTAELAQTMKKLLPQSFYSFNERYVPGSSITVSDLNSRLFVMRKPDGTYKEVSTYGMLSGDEPGYVAENVPAGLKEIVEFVTSYDNPDAIALYPEYYEVVIEPYHEDAKKNVKWPKELPDLNDSKTIRHKKYGRYSIFVNITNFANYEKLRDITFKQWKSKAAMLINNKRWVVEQRIPFPSEAIWLGNFRD